MTRSDEVLAILRTDIETRLEFELDEDGWTIVQSVWSQTIGDYLNDEQAAGRDPWTADRKFRLFVRKWAFFVAGEIQQVSEQPSGDEVRSACHRAILHAHEECTAVLAAGRAPIDPRAFVAFGPFCTTFLRSNG
jgi:hypothetical protein